MSRTIDVHQHFLPDFFWRETNEGAHPVGGITPPPWTESTALALPDSLIDFTADTTRAVAEMLYGNRFARTSNVKYIFSHAGGTIPYLAGRFGIVDEMRVIPGADARRTAAETFRGLYWDTALAFGNPVLRMLRSVVGLERVMCGSDYPYFRHDLAVGCIAALRHTEELAASEREAVLGANALELFPRLADGSASPSERLSRL
jgi:aminocarboxymuconate-semialdehyde decarboxylase